MAHFMGCPWRLWSQKNQEVMALAFEMSAKPSGPHPHEVSYCLYGPEGVNSPAWAFTSGGYRHISSASQSSHSQVSEGPYTQPQVLPYTHQNGWHPECWWQSTVLLHSQLPSPRPGRWAVALADSTRKRPYWSHDHLGHKLCEWCRSQISIIKFRCPWKCGVGAGLVTGRLAGHPGPMAMQEPRGHEAATETQQWYTHLM